MSLAFVNDSATVSTTEYFLASDSTSKTSQTDDSMLQAWIHVASMADGDQFRIRIYEKVNAIELTIIDSIISDAQSGPWVSPALIVGDGWEVSIIKVAGTDRTVHWSLRKAT